MILLLNKAIYLCYPSKYIKTNKELNQINLKEIKDHKSEQSDSYCTSPTALSFENSAPCRQKLRLLFTRGHEKVVTCLLEHHPESHNGF